jgi:hypothetical protein
LYTLVVGLPDESLPGLNRPRRWSSVQEVWSSRGNPLLDVTVHPVTLPSVPTSSL